MRGETDNSEGGEELKQNRGFKAGFILGIVAAVASGSGIGMGVAYTLAFSFCGTVVDGCLECFSAERRAAAKPKHVATFPPAKQSAYDLMRKVIKLDKRYAKASSLAQKAALALDINKLLIAVVGRVTHMEGGLQLYKEHIVESQKAEQQWLDRILLVGLKLLSAQEVESDGEDDAVVPSALPRRCDSQHSMTLFASAKRQSKPNQKQVTFQHRQS